MTRPPVFFPLLVALGLATGACESAQRVREIEGPDAATDRTDAEPAPPADAGIDAQPAPDAAPLAGLCAVEIVVLDDAGGPGEVVACPIDDAATPPCEALARCLCEALAAPELEICLDAVLRPRGALNLSDFCTTGIALDVVLARGDWQSAAPGKFALRWTPACADRIAE